MLSGRQAVRMSSEEGGGAQRRRSRGEVDCRLPMIVSYLPKPWCRRRGSTCSSPPGGGGPGRARNRTAGAHREPDQRDRVHESPQLRQGGGRLLRVDAPPRAPRARRARARAGGLRAVVSLAAHRAVRRPPATSTTRGRSASPRSRAPAEETFLRIFEVIVDRSADKLEHAGAECDELSRGAFRVGKPRYGERSPDRAPPRRGRGRSAPRSCATRCSAWDASAPTSWRAASRGRRRSTGRG